MTRSATRRTILAVITALLLLGQAAGQAPRAVPGRQVFSGAEEFRKELASILGAAPAPGDQVFLEGQRLFYEEGPGGKAPKAVVVDWAVGERAYVLVTLSTGGRRVSALVKPDRQKDQLAEWASAAAGSRFDPAAAAKAAKAAGRTYDPAELWSDGDLLPGSTPAADTARAAYALYRSALGARDFRTAEAYLGLALRLSSWSASLVREWSGLAKDSGKPELEAKAAALAAFLDCGDSYASGPAAGQNLQALAISPAPATVRFVQNPDRSYAGYDVARVKAFIKDLSVYADARGKGELAYDLALFLARRDPGDAERAAFERQLSEQHPDLAKRYARQRLFDLASSLEVTGDPAFADLAKAEAKAALATAAE